MAAAQEEPPALSPKPIPPPEFGPTSTSTAVDLISPANSPFSTPSSDLGAHCAAWSHAVASLQSHRRRHRRRHRHPSSGHQSLIPVCQRSTLVGVRSSRSWVWGSIGDGEERGAAPPSHSPSKSQVYKRDIMEMVDGAIIDQRHRKRKHMHMQDMSVLGSVIAILVEVLSRVPGSFLSRLRFVCKLWHTVITQDLLLSELHFLRGFGSTSPSIVVLCRTFPQPIHYLTLMDGAGGCQRDVLIIGTIQTRISPSCNGLLCIYDRMKNVSIFNPTTQQEFVLPPTNAESYKAFNLCFLGYVATTKEYKVLSCTQPSSFILTTCEVITIGTTRSWRQIAPPNFDQFKLNEAVTGSMWKGVVINGFVYCMVRTLEHLRQKGQILCFDFNSEKFQTIKFLRFVSDLDSLLELEGRLCVASRTGCGSMEIWMLEDVTSHDWICRYTLRISPTRFVYQPVLFHQGKILIRSHEELYYQDLKTGEDSEVIYRGPRMVETQGHIKGLFIFRDIMCSKQWCQIVAGVR